MSITKISKIFNSSSWEEYFENPMQEYNNLHKDSINLIYWNKLWSYIKHVPDNYNAPWTQGYALMRWLNCQAKCNYCYLQTYFKSPDMVRFQNIDDYLNFLEQFIIRFKQEYWNDKVLFFYDWDFQDSLGYFWIKENIDQINKLQLLFSKFDNVYLEIRTKCILVNWELKIENWNYISWFDIYKDLLITKSLITAITFWPQELINKYEPWTASLETRIEFAKYISSRWWQIWVRVDPIILDTDNIDFCINLYITQVEKLKENIKESSIYNWSIWILRIKDFLYKNLKKNRSNLINNLYLDDGFRKYKKDVREHTYKMISQAISSNKLFVCMDTI